MDVGQQRVRQEGPDRLLVLGLGQIEHDQRRRLGLELGALVIYGPRVKT